MLFTNVMTYSILGVLGGFSLIKSVSAKRSVVYTLFMNSILGGILYILLNLVGMNIPMNIIVGSCIGILGVPGVALIVALKILFHFSI